jgi:hypothetical protein
MRSSHRRQSWALAAAALLIVCLWPPSNDRSLAAKAVNWAVDPWDSLPVLPGPLALGQGDDPELVAVHDQAVQEYDLIYERGGWARRRLALKVAGDPFDPSTERQVLAALAVLIAFLFWRLDDAVRRGRTAERS